MAKSKQKAVKTPKKRSTKYGKLAAVCAKELSAKKAALVRAEKALAKAQKNHTELLSEVARLDMLDRSLKALINGTEPPQNVRYVYTYPQWVWQGNPYGWWWNGNGYTYTGGLTQPSYTYTNAGYQNGQNSQFNVNTINTVAGDAPVLTTTTGALTSGSNATITCNASNSLIGYNSSGISLDNSNGSIPSSFTFNNVQSSIPSGPSGTADLTVDLSTGAPEEDKDVDVTEKEVLAVAEKVGHGG
jgi:hypothetical protein